jgi:hypothetical protein
MSASKKTRKKYRPGMVNIDPMPTMIENACKLNAAKSAAVITNIRKAHDEVKKGDHDKPWKGLADTFNVAEQLSVLGICSDPDSLAIILGAQKALADIHDRDVRSDRACAVRAQEVAAIDAAIERYAIQLAYCSRREYDRAIARTIELVRQSIAGNGGPSIRHCGFIGTVVTSVERLTAPS